VQVKCIFDEPSEEHPASNLGSTRRHCQACERRHATCTFQYVHRKPGRPKGRVKSSTRIAPHRGVGPSPSPADVGVVDVPTDGPCRLDGPHLRICLIGHEKHPSVQNLETHPLENPTTSPIDLLPRHQHQLRCRRHGISSRIAYPKPPPTLGQVDPPRVKASQLYRSRRSMTSVSVHPLGQRDRRSRTPHSQHLTARPCPG
jgi:hypothetical protein